jgi:hypothetical protein
MRDHEQVCAHGVFLVDRHHVIVHLLWMPLAQFCLILLSPSSLKKYFAQFLAILANLYNSTSNFNRMKNPEAPPQGW